MKGKYAVKLSITEITRLVGNEENIITVAYGKCKCGLTPDVVNATHISCQSTCDESRPVQVVFCPVGLPGGAGGRGEALQALQGPRQPPAAVARLRHLQLRRHPLSGPPHRSTRGAGGK